jgi:hypothetical protein
MPLSLTDRQLNQVMRAAQLVPLADRDSFLRSIAGRVNGEPATDAVIEEAIYFVLCLRGIATAPLALHDAEPNFPMDHRSTKGGHNGHSQQIPFARRPLRSQRR